MNIGFQKDAIVVADLIVMAIDQKTEVIGTFPELWKELQQEQALYGPCLLKIKEIRNEKTKQTE